LRPEIPKEVSPDEPVVRSLHWHLHYEAGDRVHTLEEKRIRPDALIGAKQHGYDCSVSRLAYTSWDRCKSTARYLEKQDDRKTYVQMLVICVWAAHQAGIDVVHKPTKDNPAHACLSYGKAVEKRYRKAAALIKMATAKRGLLYSMTPRPSRPTGTAPRGKRPVPAATAPDSGQPVRLGLPF
jgi:glucuronate isomerase